jgi:hypothetical protein
MHEDASSKTGRSIRLLTINYIKVAKRQIRVSVIAGRARRKHGEHARH